MNKSTFSLAAAAATLVLAASPARADFTVIDLNQNNLSLGNITVGTVKVDRTSSTTATFTFTALLVSGTQYLFTDGGAAAANVNAASWSFSGLSASNSIGNGNTAGTLADGGSGNEDGFGNFNQTFNLGASFTRAADSISFTITNDSGTWATVGDVLSGNNKGNLVAAHIGICVAPGAGCTEFVGGFGGTGFASGNGFPSASSVLEPNSASLAVLALGLLGAGFWTRRKV